MKKLVLLFWCLAVTMMANAQSTLSDMSNTQIDKILNHCNKIVVRTTLMADDGKLTEPGQRPSEDFTLIYDYPHERGCDFYIGGTDHGYHMSRPMNARRLYTDDNSVEVPSDKATHLQFYFYDSFFKNHILVFDFHEGDGVFKTTTDMLLFVDKKLTRAHRIYSVDFYDRSGGLIAKSYLTGLADDKENGNLLRCFIDKAYNRYK